MQRGHGHGEPLNFADVDIERIDAALASGGADREAVRMLQANRFLGPGRFGKMFHALEAFRPPDDALRALGEAMHELTPPDPARNTDIPAGYTYLGQFIDHDLTFDFSEG